MKIFRKITSVLMLMLFIGLSFVIYGQTTVNYRNAAYTVRRLEINADQFRDSVNLELRNNVRGSALQAQISAFEWATNRLRERIENNEVIQSDIENVMSRALLIERSLQTVKLSPEARADWMRIRNNLDQLAKSYNVAWAWTLEGNTYWKNPRAAEQIVDDLEDSTDAFRHSFDHAIDNSPLNGTKTEDAGIELAEEFEDQVDRWEDLADQERLSEANLKLLLNRAAILEAFMQTNNINDPRAWRDWMKIRANLDALIMMSNIKWTWKANPIITDRTRW